MVSDSICGVNRWTLLSPVSFASGVSFDQRYSWDDGRSFSARESQSTRSWAEGSIRLQSAKDCTRL